ncbi:IS21 family transposase [Cryobacterium ruanii]|uniref:IS21 family transposase n=1 Tax=Cryobacterium ruanii TaxID=1259197 RepID=UPI0018E0C20A|nr:IS21 family transposase [Cryobacterium ruanii]
MADYRKILGLLLEGRSYREIVEIARCSHRDVARVRQEVQQRGRRDRRGQRRGPGRVVPRRAPERIGGVRPARLVASIGVDESEPALHVAVAWRHYVDTKDAGKKYRYSQFCALFTDYLRRHDLVAVQRHEPGRAMLIDWAGDTMDVVDTITGEVVKAILFVAVLPFSGLMFCRAYADMKAPAWLDAHVQAFAFFGGVTQIVVPDNPTTSTHQTHKGDAERVVNARYQQLAGHYQTAIVLARVKKPRDKAAAENAVNVVNKPVIGYLEDDVFTTLGEMNAAIEERMRKINHDIRRADDTTRWERFDAEERELLAPLPDAGFEDVEWKELKAARNYHVTADTQRYSVPFGLAGKLLRVRLTSSRVTVFDGHESICEHPRLTGHKGQYSTLPDHVPPQHRDIDGQWSRRWFTDRARSVGPATVTVIEQILDSQAIEAQGYLSCQNILDGLGKNNRERLEAACQELVNRSAHPTYSTLKRLMAAIDSDAKKPRPMVPAASTRKHVSTVVFHDTMPDVYVRDASHYARDEESK